MSVYEENDQRKEYVIALFAKFEEFFNNEDIIYNATIFSKEFYSGKRAIKIEYAKEKKAIVVSDECPSKYLYEYKEKIEKLKGTRTPRSVVEKKFPRTVNGKLVPIETYQGPELDEHRKNFSDGNLLISDEACFYLVRPNTKDWWEVVDAGTDVSVITLTAINNKFE